MEKETTPAELELYARAVADHPCRICNAKPGVKCGSITDASVYFERPHYTRLAAARERAVEGKA